MLWFKQAVFILHTVNKARVLRGLEAAKCPDSWDWLGAKMGLLAGVSVSLHMDLSTSLLGLPHVMVAVLRRCTLTASIPRGQSPMCQHLSNLCLHLTNVSLTNASHKAKPVLNQRCYRRPWVLGGVSQWGQCNIVCHNSSSSFTNKYLWNVPPIHLYYPFSLP